MTKGSTLTETQDGWPRELTLSGGPLDGLPITGYGMGFLIGVKAQRMVLWSEAAELAHYSDMGVYSHSTPRPQPPAGMP